MKTQLLLSLCTIVRSAVARYLDISTSSSLKCKSHILLFRLRRGKADWCLSNSLYGNKHWSGRWSCWPYAFVFVSFSSAFSMRVAGDVTTFIPPFSRWSGGYWGQIQWLYGHRPGYSLDESPAHRKAMTLCWLTKTPLGLQIPDGWLTDSLAALHQLYSWCLLPYEGSRWLMWGEIQDRLGIILGMSKDILKLLVVYSNWCWCYSSVRPPWNCWLWKLNVVHRL